MIRTRTSKSAVVVRTGNETSPVSVTPAQTAISRQLAPQSPMPPPAARSATPTTSSGRPLLSILVPTVPGRELKLARLLAILDPQVQARPDVELLAVRDSRGMSIGEKRTKMVRLARGQYVAFVDDDDVVAADYVSAIVAGLETAPDVLTFNVRVEAPTGPKPCRYGLHLQHADLSAEYHRKPNHLMVWRRQLAMEVPFPSVGFGEDTAWAEQIAGRATTEVALNRELYTYLVDPNDNSSTPR